MSNTADQTNNKWRKELSNLVPLDDVGLIDIIYFPVPGIHWHIIQTFWHHFRRTNAECMDKYGVLSTDGASQTLKPMTSETLTLYDECKLSDLFLKFIRSDKDVVAMMFMRENGDSIYLKYERVELTLNCSQFVMLYVPTAFLPLRLSIGL